MFETTNQQAIVNEDYIHVFSNEDPGVPIRIWYLIESISNLHTNHHVQDKIMFMFLNPCLSLFENGLNERETWVDKP